MNRLRVDICNADDRSYEILIGEEILDEAGMILLQEGRSWRHFIVTDASIDALHGELVQNALERKGLRTDRIVVPEGEEAKRIETVLTLTERLTALGADRQTVLIALGGGVIGDMTGFAASIYLRGVPVVQIPTTLLAQVDSSIGGKTGVDTAAGKNLLGTFKQPKAVFIDTAFLRTLPDTMLRSGVAEVIKYGAIDSPALLDEIGRAAAGGTMRETAFLERIITASCTIKKKFVEIDEFDRGARQVLNFGHTVGHAVEAASGYRLSHGEAVAIGMVAAARLSEKMCGLPPDESALIAEAIKSVGLPGRIPSGIDPSDIFARLSFDKKREGGTVRFVMLEKLGAPVVNAAIPEDVVREILAALKEE